MSAFSESVYPRGEKYKDLVRTYYEGVTVTDNAYDSVTSRRMCPCLEHSHRCSFPLNGKVTRYYYDGENVCKK